MAAGPAKRWGGCKRRSCRLSRMTLCLVIALTMLAGWMGILVGSVVVHRDGQQSPAKTVDVDLAKRQRLLPEDQQIEVHNNAGAVEEEGEEGEGEGVSTDMPEDDEEEENEVEVAEEREKQRVISMRESLLTRAPSATNSPSKQVSSRKPIQNKAVPIIRRTLPPKMKFVSTSKWNTTDEDELFALSRDALPRYSEAALRLRAEFGSMEVCQEHIQWYSCSDNPTCIEIVNCSHRIPNDVHFGSMHTAPLRFIDQAPRRLEALRAVLKRMQQVTGYPNHEKVIFMMTFNSGFSFLFGNWYCSLLANGINVKRIKQRTMILARDADARSYVESLGFFAPTLQEISELAHWTEAKTITRKAASGFGQGNHNLINLFFKFGMPLDLITLNYTTINQDVDFVWMRDPLDEIRTICRDTNCDGIFIGEGRMFTEKGGMDRGPWRPAPVHELNTGLFSFPPKAQVKHFLQVLMQGIYLQLWRRRDQMYYNTVMMHKHFAHMNWQRLSDDDFIPGKRLHRSELLKRPLKPKKELGAIHVSDTGNFEIKINRLKAIDHWYFKFETCPVPVRSCRLIPTCWNSLATCTDCNVARDSSDNEPATNADFPIVD